MNGNAALRRRVPSPYDDRTRQAASSGAQQYFWVYTAWTLTIGRAAYHPEMQPVDTCRAIVHRTATAIDDLDAFSSVEL